MSNAYSVSTALDDVLGSSTSALDTRLCMTTFSDGVARTKSEEATSLRELAKQVHLPSAKLKSQLPWLKLAKFGDVPTTKGSLRHDANVLSVSGIEGDYDAGQVSLAEAAATLRLAGIAALLYSSPSHTSEAPRWRVLCPLSVPASPEQRERLCARLNGVLAGILSPESFTLSQAYYFGRVEGSNPPEMALIEGIGLDQAASLQDSALARDGSAYVMHAAPASIAAADDEDDWYRPDPEWDRIDSALSAIPVRDADQQETGGRDLWLRVGTALHHVGQGSEEAFLRWDAWSREGAKYNERDQRRTWNSLRSKRRNQLGIGTLFDIAKRYGWSAGKKSPKISNALDLLGGGPEEKATTLRFLSPSECADAPSRGYVVKGLLAPRDLACIFGAPGAGKSLISPHIGYKVALGQRPFGMRTTAGRVFYVSPEDAHGMRGRVTALRRRYGDAPDFVLVDGVSDMLREDSPDLKALRTAVNEQRPALIFLDTLAMSFPSLEENTAEAMGKVVSIARSLTLHGAAVVLIHHDTKSQGATPRGHSLLNGALDVALQLFPRDEGGVVRGKLTKNRNGSCDRDVAFRIATECLGQDPDGDPIMVALVQEVAPGSEPKREKLSGGEQAAMRILDELSRQGPVTEAVWREACVESRTVCESEERKSRQTATRRAFQKLLRSNVVVLLDGQAFRSGSIDLAGDSAS